MGSTTTVLQFTELVSFLIIFIFCNLKMARQGEKHEPFCLMTENTEKPLLLSLLSSLSSNQNFEPKDKH